MFIYNYNCLFVYNYIYIDKRIVDIVVIYKTQISNIRDVTLNIVSIGIVHLSNLYIIKLMCDTDIYNIAIYDIDIMAPGPPP